VVCAITSYGQPIMDRAMCAHIARAFESADSRSRMEMTIDSLDWLYLAHGLLQPSRSHVGCCSVWTTFGRRAGDNAPWLSSNLIYPMRQLLFMGTSEPERRSVTTVANNNIRSAPSHSGPASNSSSSLLDLTDSSDSIAEAWAQQTDTKSLQDRELNSPTAA
jgi:hypothetical protein